MSRWLSEPHGHKNAGERLDRGGRVRVAVVVAVDGVEPVGDLRDPLVDAHYEAGASRRVLIWILVGLANDATLATT